MARLYFTLLILVLTAAACSSPKVATIWKSGTKRPAYDKILVVSIVKDESDSARKARETEFVAQLHKIGYGAVSAYEMFGAKGLGGMSEESTYIKLCDNGIDAVLTLALTSEAGKMPATNQAYYTSAYYYNRIWNYSKIDNTPSVTNQGLWESILFDLSLLEPAFVGRTQPFLVNAPYEDQKLAQWFVNKLVKEKVLKRGKQLTNIIKPF